MATSEVVIEIRADNGPQFVAGLVRTYFRENGVSHVFTKPSAPQEISKPRNGPVIKGGKTERWVSH